MKCPHCDVLLQMADRQGIEIDYCPQCRGVWLDRGELDKIIDRVTAETVNPSVAPQNQQPPQGYQQQGYQQPQDYQQGHSHKQKYDHHKGYKQGYYKHKKRKSVIGEIFDIFD
ncbi:zf-TFIIB domain-containing protein [Motiliproteus sp. MSK22-1]|uniref:TFIIB-type zinc ribbon-containing protein n=1 Tax=Motiliproteus sp. MSK22-1 TaxID=1897630 RepID=UPI0009775B63|nr:zf-TFIIB domain-containing protein [Motiliproteus sp. MSK22-1]OMH31661.1 hypothetical protein BGP75_16145 [Motiliproteus sp. MSK22-1]